MTSKMTQKEKQEFENDIALGLWYTFLENTDYHDTHWKRLYYCSAEIGNNGRYLILRSYNTVVAFYDTKNDLLVDMLRYVYGYTATSAKHIAKFRNYIDLEYRLYKTAPLVEYRFK